MPLVDRGSPLCSADDEALPNRMMAVLTGSCSSVAFVIRSPELFRSARSHQPLRTTASAYLWHSRRRRWSKDEARSGPTIQKVVAKISGDDCRTTPANRLTQPRGSQVDLSTRRRSPSKVGQTEPTSTDCRSAARCRVNQSNPPWISPPLHCRISRASLIARSAFWNVG